MKYLLLGFLFYPLTCWAQSAGTFGPSGLPITVTAPPASSKPTFKPCAQGECRFGKKQRKKRNTFGARRKKSLSTFGKGGQGQNRRSKSILGGGKNSKSRNSRRYRR